MIAEDEAWWQLSWTMAWHEIGQAVYFGITRDDLDDRIWTPEEETQR